MSDQQPTWLGIPEVAEILAIPTLRLRSTSSLAAVDSVRPKFANATRIARGVGGRAGGRAGETKTATVSPRQVR